MPNCDMLAKGRASSWKNSALHRLSWCTVGALRVLLIPFPGARSRSLGRGPAVLRQKETSCPKAATRTPRAGTPAASPNLAKASACCGAVLRGKPCLCVADAPAAPVWQRGFSWGGPGACSPLKPPPPPRGTAKHSGAWHRFLLAARDSLPPRPPLCARLRILPAVD